MLGTPVEVVFLSSPVASPDRAVPLIFTTVAASVPLVVTSPLRSPLVTDVAPENLARLPVAGEPVVVTVPEPAAAWQAPSAPRYRTPEHPVKSATTCAAELIPPTCA